METFISAAPDIDVQAIMNAIQKKIQEKKDAGLLKQSEIDDIAHMELQPLPDFLEIPNVYEPHLYTRIGQFTAFPAPVDLAIQETGPVKGILKKIRRLLMPLIRFMTRPLLHELNVTLVDTQNHLFKHIPIVLQSREYVRLLHNALNNMIVEASKLKTEEELLKTKMKILEDKIEFLENRERALEKKLSPS